ncbi:hypothetical protein ABW19_dt0201568 [Dactylella cylindrospora]|nr:hypothetical protein ABW19_dt0201568 [Dactylella cylindrospora]
MATLRSSTRLLASRPTSAIASRLLPQTRVAAFHASQRRQILPPGPQVVIGTVNDPVPVPTPSATHGSYHWAFERLISVGLVPLVVAPFAAGTANPTLDAALGTLLVLHSHIGFDACVTDYFPKRQHPKLRALMEWLLRGATVAAAVGLFAFQTNDVGLTEGVKRVWKA